MGDSKKLFVDADEKEISILGGDYLNNFLEMGTLECGFCVVSDKRVYFRGKCYHKTNNHYRSSYEERMVDLKDVTGTGFVESKNLLLMVLAIISTIYLIFCLLSDKSGSSLRNISNILTSTKLTIEVESTNLIIAIILCIGFWTAYFIVETRLFEISFAGGKIAFKASNYNMSEMQEFQKELRRAKDEYTETTSVMPSGKNGSCAAEIKKFKELLDMGAITQEEYDIAKKEILSTKKIYNIIASDEQ